LNSFDIINVFTVTFDSFNASLLNKSINFFQRNKILLTPNFWMVVYFLVRQPIFQLKPSVGYIIW